MRAIKTDDNQNPNNRHEGKSTNASTRRIPNSRKTQRKPSDSHEDLNRSDVADGEEKPIDDNRPGKRRKPHDARPVSKTAGASTDAEKEKQSDKQIDSSKRPRKRRIPANRGTEKPSSNHENKVSREKRSGKMSDEPNRPMTKANNHHRGKHPKANEDEVDPRLQPSENRRKRRRPKKRKPENPDEMFYDGYVEDYSAPLDDPYKDIKLQDPRKGTRSHADMPAEEKRAQYSELQPDMKAPYISEYNAEKNPRQERPIRSGSENDNVLSPDSSMDELYDSYLQYFEGGENAPNKSEDVSEGINKNRKSSKSGNRKGKKTAPDAAKRSSKTKKPFSKKLIAMDIVVGIIGIALIIFAAVNFFMQPANISHTSNAPIAATLNGTEIKESDITQKINTFRAENYLVDDEAWAQYLVDTDNTPETMRTNMIEELAGDILVSNDAIRRGITATENEVYDAIAQIKAANAVSDDEFMKLLQQDGKSYDEFLNDIKMMILSEKLKQNLSNGTSNSDENLLYSINAIAADYERLRAYKVIVLTGDDWDEANRIVEGTLENPELFDFEYSEDSNYPYDFSGWELNVYMEQNILDASNDLSVGDITRVLPIGDRLYIAKVVGEVFLGENGFDSIDDVPTDIVNYYRKQNVDSDTGDFEEYRRDLLVSANLLINPMPSGLPYDVSLSGFQKNPENSVLYQEENSESEFPDMSGSDESGSDDEDDLESAAD